MSRKHSNSIYISQNVPNSLVKTYNVSQAANNFCLHINDIGYFSHHIAIPPGNIDGSFKSFNEKATGIEYHICRPFKHKGFGKLVNLLLDNIWLFYRILKAQERNVWFYNVWIGNILSYLLIRFLSRKKSFVLLADYNPQRYNNRTGKLLLWAIRQACGVISLSSRCKEVNTNFKAIAGIIPEKNIKKGIGKFYSNKSFLLSGTLNANTGLYLALNVFKDIPEATLFLSGLLSEECVQTVNEYTEKYSNIIYKGFFEQYDDYISFIQSVDFTLSLRAPESPVNHYNFPSKILETLAYNKIIISTIEYPELDGINYIVIPYSESEFKKSIKRIILEGRKQYIEKCLNNADVLRDRYTEKAWLDAFIEMETKVNK